jgi:hypothetical protein
MGFACVFDAAGSRVVDEEQRYFCETSASAGDGAEFKNRIDEKPADDAHSEVFASAVFFAGKQPAEQQPRALFAKWLPVHSNKFTRAYRCASS